VRQDTDLWDKAAYVASSPTEREARLDAMEQCVVKAKGHKSNTLCCQCSECCGRGKNATSAPEMREYYKRCYEEEASTGGV